MLRKEEEKNYTVIFSRIKSILLIQFSAEYLPNRCDLLTCAKIKESCLKIIQDWHFFSYRLCIVEIRWSSGRCPVSVASSSDL